MMTGRFLRSLYVGKMTEYLCVFGVEKEPCMLKAALLSNGFIETAGRAASFTGRDVSVTHLSLWFD